MSKPEIDEKALAAFKAELERWGDVEDTWEPAHAALRAYLATTRTSEAAEPVAYVGKGLIPVYADEFAKMQKREMGIAKLYDTPLYAAPHPSPASEEVTDRDLYQFLEAHGWTYRNGAIAIDPTGEKLVELLRDFAGFLASLRSPKL